ncbi:MAG: hypothetical protein J7K36_01950 [Archaeoglobaceae archaeon]|nr:hypothetical protein [Archaeoglobaceae archaeon]
MYAFLVAFFWYAPDMCKELYEHQSMAPLEINATDATGFVTKLEQVVIAEKPEVHNFKPEIGKLVTSSTISEFFLRQATRYNEDLHDSIGNIIEKLGTPLVS